MRVYAQNWTEYERGWGQRPDGWSCAENPKEFERFVKEMRQREGNLATGQAPDEYSAPCGDPFIIDLNDPEMCGQFAAGKTHIWGKGNRCPLPKIDPLKA